MRRQKLIFGKKYRKNENLIIIYMTDKLLIFSNCQGIARFNAWEETGGTLLGNKSIGCGINSLCFLGVFTKELGEHLVKNILPSGTTFLDILYYLNALSSSKVIYTEHVYNLSTLPDLTNTLNLLHQLMPENSCTIVKLNRPSDMLGHTIVFSKENDILYTLNEERLPLIVTHKHTARVLMKHLLKIRDEEFEDYELPEKKIIMVYLKDDLSYDTHKELDFYNTEKKVIKNK
jgi:hypothetical protein